MVSASDIAVVIAARNAEATIDAALASIAAQSVEVGAVVVVDDGSTDRTAKRALAWSGRLPLTVVSCGGTGPGPARHAGISSVEQGHIALLDSDDYWLPDHLSSLVSVYRGPGTLATTSIVRWIPGEGVCVNRAPPLAQGKQQLLALLDDNYVNIDVLFARDDYERVGGFRVGVAEDWDLWIRMVRAGVAIVTTGHETAIYRLSRTGITSAGGAAETATETLRRAIEESADKAERTCARRGLRERRRRLALARAYHAALSGQPWRARRLALGAARGPLPVTIRALALVVAPGIAAAERERRRWAPRRWLRS